MTQSMMPRRESRGEHQIARYNHPSVRLLSGATSHSGRRTGLTNLAERGVGVRVLMALAGHSNMATTQRYIDLRPAMLKAAVELV